jgi:putative transposase
LLSKIWRDWISELILFRPETVIQWRKRKFREFWRRKSQGKPGRPSIPQKHIDCILRLNLPIYMSLLGSGAFAEK